MPELTPVASRAEQRQSAGANAFDRFHERRDAGSPLAARRQRIEAQIRPVAGGAPSAEEEASWSVPGEINEHGVRTGGTESATAPENNPGSSSPSIYDRFREGATGVIGWVRRRRRGNPSPDHAGTGPPLLDPLILLLQNQHLLKNQVVSPLRVQLQIQILEHAYEQ